MTRLQLKSAPAKLKQKPGIMTKEKLGYLQFQHQRRTSKVFPLRVQVTNTFICPEMTRHCD